MNKAPIEVATKVLKPCKLKENPVKNLKPIIILIMPPSINQYSVAIVCLIGITVILSLLLSFLFECKESI